MCLSTPKIPNTPAPLPPPPPIAEAAMMKIQDANATGKNTKQMGKKQLQIPLGTAGGSGLGIPK